MMSFSPEVLLVKLLQDVLVLSHLAERRSVKLLALYHSQKEQATRLAYGCTSFASPTAK